MASKTSSTIYRVVSRVWQGGGEQSRHRTLEGAQRALQRADAAVRRLNRYGGTSYHDCVIEERTEDGWEPIDA